MHLFQRRGSMEFPPKEATGGPVTNPFTKRLENQLKFYNSQHNNHMRGNNPEGLSTRGKSPDELKEIIQKLKAAMIKKEAGYRLLKDDYDKKIAELEQTISRNVDMKQQKLLETRDKQLKECNDSKTKAKNELDSLLVEHKKILESIETVLSTHKKFGSLLETHKKLHNTNKNSPRPGSPRPGPTRKNMPRPRPLTRTGSIAH